MSCYCYYKSDKSIANVYGNLYNLTAVADKRNICPKGWRIPSERDIKTLINYLSSSPGVGNKLKESGSLHWDSQNTNSTNASGFTAPREF